MDNLTRGLTFVSLNIYSLNLIIFTDTSFANNKDLSSQIRFVIVLIDQNQTTNIIHWSLIKCKRVTRSVLASKLYTLAHGFNIRATIKLTIKKILQIDTLLFILYT